MTKIYCDRVCKHKNDIRVCQLDQIAIYSAGTEEETCQYREIKLIED